MKSFYLLHLLSKTVWGVFFSCSISNMLSEGLSLSQSCFAFFSLTVFIGLFEVPFGYIADRYGRKMSVLVGFICSGIGFSLLAYSPALINLAMACIAAGITLVSGADKAWYLSQLNPALKEQENIFLNLSLVERLAMVIGALLGPYLMQKSPDLVWIASAVLSFFAALYGLSLPEEKEKPLKEREKNSPTLNIKQLKAGVSAGFFVIMLSGLFYGFSEGGKSMVIQPYIESITNKWVWILTVHQIACVIFRISGIIFYKKIIQPMGNHATTAVFCSYLVMILSQIVAFNTSNYAVFILFFGLAIVALGWGEPLTCSVLNQMIQNDKLKATYFSFHSMVLHVGEASSYLYLSYHLTGENLHLGWRMGAIGLIASALVFSMGIGLNRLASLSEDTREPVQG